MTILERDHVGKVKEGPCVICHAVCQTEAHEIEQGLWFTSISLCPDCHGGPMGIHGDKTLWRIHKMSELRALNKTLERVLSE